MRVKIGNSEIEAPLAKMRMLKRNNNVFTSMYEERGLDFFTSVIAANRINDVSNQAYQDLFNPSIKAMPFWSLKDIDVAAERISKARVNNEKIGLVTDFDVDGISSAVVMKLALVKYLGFDDDKVKIYVNNRMKFGYGFKEKALENIKQTCDGEMPTLLITADQGSNDSHTIGLYKKYMSSIGQENCDVIVTDHHEIDDGNKCEEAIAFVNPQRPDDDFDDKTICGCVVALLVMSATREQMIEDGVVPPSTPRLSPLLTYACLATVADCVSLASGYNRCIVRRGLRDINNEAIPAWSILKRKINKPADLINVEDLGFTLGPLINADSRTGGDGAESLKFLMAETEEEAEYYYEKLRSRNTRRKEVDLSMQEQAMIEGSRQYYEEGRRALVIYLPKGSHGIHGIVASRVKDMFNCPCIIFSPVDVKEKDSDEKIITGSGRCIDGYSIVDMVIGNVGKKINVEGGGHKAAMGLKIKLGDLPAFHEAFDAVLKDQASKRGLTEGFTPEVLIDHVFQGKELDMLKDLNMLKQVNKLEPYGQKFEAPIFAINGVLDSTRAFGKDLNLNAHMNFFVKDAQRNKHKMLVWNYQRCPWVNILQVGKEYTFAVTLKYDSYGRTVGMMLVNVAEGFNALS